jgi:hypothetical protein
MAGKKYVDPFPFKNVRNPQELEARLRRLVDNDNDLSERLEVLESGGAVYAYSTRQAIALTSYVFQPYIANVVAQKNLGVEVDSGASETRYVVKAKGIYSVTVFVRFDDAVGGTRGVRLSVNGIPYREFWQLPDGDGRGTIHAEWNPQLKDGDYITVRPVTSNPTGNVQVIEVRVRGEVYR